jgi:hypothetical protein
MLLKKNYWIQKNKLQCPKDWLRPSLQSNAFKKNYWIQKNKLQCPKDWLRPSSALRAENQQKKLQLRPK